MFFAPSEKTDLSRYRRIVMLPDPQKIPPRPDKSGRQLAFTETELTASDSAAL
jgi:hypothetical protein